LHRFFLAFSFLAALLAPHYAFADDFYHGKTITIVVGFSPGGGFDVNARVLARYLPRHIPGNPAVVVQNMPGAASITSVLYLDATAPKDGTVIDTFNFGEIGESVLEPKRAPVDFRNYAWLGSVSDDMTVCYVWHSLGVDTLAQLQRHGLIHTGLTSIGSSSDINQRILKYIFGIKLQQVAGYPGSAEERLGIERGEIDGDCGAWSSIPPQWISDNLIRPILRSSPTVAPGALSNVPFAEGVAPNENDREIIHLLVASGEVGRPFIVSKSVPADRIRILRAAFDATMKDPDFLRDLNRLGLPYSPKNATEALATVRSVYDSPKTVVDKARKIATE
jgi:tripartite-type tricarboxylate transporter receptor subunit TctC